MRNNNITNINTLIKKQVFVKFENNTTTEPEESLAK